MTTIAMDGVQVAADSQRVCGSERVDVCTEKIKVEAGVVFAFTGDYALFQPAIAWYLAGADPKEAPQSVKDSDWRLVVCAPHRAVSYLSTMPYAEHFSYPTAFGSGAHYAQAMLHIGKTAAEAVAVASELDVYTAGPIQVVNIPCHQPVATKNGAAEYDHPYDRFSVAHPL